MTTDKEITPGIVGFPRDLSDLLALGTYQGMTDEEIDMVLDYLIRVEISKRESIAKLAALEAEMEGKIQAERESCANMEAMLKSVIERAIPAFTFEPPKKVDVRPLEV